jgi:hypothetical protein
LLLSGLAGCVPTAEQQAAAFTPVATATAARARQSRRFESEDLTLMLQASVSTLQDLGFTIEETQTQNGVIVGSKAVGARIRAQILVQRSATGNATVVRATFQRIVPRPGAMLAFGEVLDTPELYRGFFEKLSQSAFLTAHEI